jgi:hypothetical protein
MYFFNDLLHNITSMKNHIVNEHDFTLTCYPKQMNVVAKAN